MEIKPSFYSDHLEYIRLGAGKLFKYFYFIKWENVIVMLFFVFLWAHKKLPFKSNSVKICECIFWELYFHIAHWL